MAVRSLPPLSLSRKTPAASLPCYGHRHPGIQSLAVAFAWKEDHQQGHLVSLHAHISHIFHDHQVCRPKIGAYPTRALSADNMGCQYFVQLWTLATCHSFGGSPPSTRRRLSDHIPCPRYLKGVRGTPRGSLDGRMRPEWPQCLRGTPVMSDEAKPQLVKCLEKNALRGNTLYLEEGKG